jgi:LPXTG-motif cell wall-anchored protein
MTTRRCASRWLVLVIGTAALITGLWSAGTIPVRADEGGMTYTLYREADPTDDQADAYDRIDAAVGAAVARYNAMTDLTKHLSVSYNPGVPTAEASSDGGVSFGADRSYMTEGTALHEIAHALGVGTTDDWIAQCVDGTWTGGTVTALIRSWDGPNSHLNCGGFHIWPYGLNYPDEFSELAFERNVEIVEAIVVDIRDASTLAADGVSLGDTSQVTTDLHLPAVSAGGSTITWASSDPAVVATDGTVTRPEAGAPDVAVQLTPTLTLRGQSRLGHPISVVVLALEAKPDAPTRPDGVTPAPGRAVAPARSIAAESRAAGFTLPAEGARPDKLAETGTATTAPAAIGIVLLLLGASVLIRRRQVSD